MLIVHSNQRPLPAGVLIDDTLRKAVAAGVGRPVELYSEFLDSERAISDDYDKLHAEFLNRKYSGLNIRVIIAVVPQAFEFVRKHRKRLLPAVPVVHLSMPHELLPARLPPEFVGATIDLDPTPTIELALRLQPAARRLVIVTGAGERDRVWDRRIDAAAGRFKDRLEIEYLRGRTTAEVLQRLAALPANSIIFTPGYFTDGTGPIITPRQSVQQMAEAASAPLYGHIDTFVGAGAVGGVMVAYEDQAKHAAAIIVRLLEGEAPAAIPAMTMQAVPIVDWRQLRRWGLDERRLPADAVVKFRAPSLWDQHRQTFAIGLAVVLLQAMLIGALLFERRGRRRTAMALEESERRMKLAARAARLSMWIWDFDRNHIWAVPRSRQQKDMPREHAIDFQEFLLTTHPADRGEVQRAVLHALEKDEEFHIEYRVIEGSDVRWIAARGRAGQPDGRRVAGVAIDITERKRVEMQAEQDRAALERMTRASMLGQLSASIAHELNQPLAAILANAEAARKMLDGAHPDVAELRAICDDIASENHRAAEVIRRLRDLYKRGDIEMTQLDLNALIRESLDLVSTELLSRHVNAVTVLEPSLPAIKGSRVQLQQVLLNLILNAADAMSGNPNTDIVMTVRTESADDTVRLSVVDRGCGIAATDLKKVFDPFWSTKRGGMGMGLAISRTIVAAHGGILSACNNAERGATFCVALPMRSSR